MRRKWSRGPPGPGVFPIGHCVGRGLRRNHLERRKNQIEAQIGSIDAGDQAARRKRETRANVVIGAVIRSHAALHSAFMPILRGILDVAVRRPADRELLASILGLTQIAEGTEVAPHRRAEIHAAHSGVPNTLSQVRLVFRW